MAELVVVMLMPRVRVQPHLQRKRGLARLGWRSGGGERGALRAVLVDEADALAVGRVGRKPWRGKVLPPARVGAGVDRDRFGCSKGGGQLDSLERDRERSAPI